MVLLWSSGTDYTFLGALLAVLFYLLAKDVLDGMLKPAVVQSSNPYVL